VLDKRLHCKACSGLSIYPCRYCGSSIHENLHDAGIEERVNAKLLSGFITHLVTKSKKCMRRNFVSEVNTFNAC